MVIVYCTYTKNTQTHNLCLLVRVKMAIYCGCELLLLISRNYSKQIFDNEFLFSSFVCKINEINWTQLKRFFLFSWKCPFQRFVLKKTLKNLSMLSTAQNVDTQIASRNRNLLSDAEIRITDIENFNNKKEFVWNHQMQFRYMTICIYMCADGKWYYVVKILRFFSFVRSRKRWIQIIKWRTKKIVFENREMTWWIYL